MSQKNQVVAIILAAGSSSRYQAGDTSSAKSSPLPKQFSTLAGKPLINYSIEVFASSAMISALVVVLPADSIQVFEQDIYKQLSPATQAKLHKPVVGGDSRLASAVKGLTALQSLPEVSNDCLVAVHDAARPLVSLRSIEECIKEAADTSAAGGAVLATPLTDSMAYVVEGKSATKYIQRNLPRAGYYALQTPQVFSAGLLDKAYQSALQQTDTSVFTDESSIVLAYDATAEIAIVEGDANNMKLTYAADKHKLEAILRRQANSESNE